MNKVTEDGVERKSSIKFSHSCFAISVQNLCLILFLNLMIKFQWILIPQVSAIYTWTTRKNASVKFVDVQQVEEVIWCCPFLVMHLFFWLVPSTFFIKHFFLFVIFNLPNFMFFFKKKLATGFLKKRIVIFNHFLMFKLHEKHTLYVKMWFLVAQKLLYTFCRCTLQKRVHLIDIYLYTSLSHSHIRHFL